MKTLFFFTSLFFLSACAVTAQLSSQSKVDQEKEIDRLIAKMSIQEKVGQTCQVTLDALLKRDSSGKALEPIQLDPKRVDEVLLEYKVGSVLNVGWHTLSLTEWKEIFTAVHAPFNKKKTKTPVIYGIDAIHGVNYTIGGTLFPQEIGLAATWDSTLAKQFGEVTAYETRASGIPWNFSPVLDLGRQPLWSRHFETLGEDAFLASALGQSIITGYRGTNGVDSKHVASCMKHFVGYSNPQSGRDRTPAWIPDKYMKELYLPPFKAAVDAGALTVMINSGVLNGIPGHYNRALITGLLKEEWGFEGFAVSDWEDFIMLHTVHRTAETLKKGIIQGFNAGVDMSMVPMSPQYKEYIKLMLEAIDEGQISEERLDDAVRRILRVKMRVGLFDKNMGFDKSYPDFGSDKHQKLALTTALESITLLENNGVLPLNKNQKVLVAGPTSNNLVYLNGAWTHTWQGDNKDFNTKGRTNVRQEIEKVVGKENVLFSQGAELYTENGFENSRIVNANDFEQKSKSADVILLCLGEAPSTEKPGDIRSLNLDEAQLELAKMAYASGKKVVLILLEGRPRIIREIVDEADAIVQAYLPGDFGAEAIGKLLYGEQDFVGNLPYTYPKYDGQIEFYDHPRSVDRAKSNEFTAYDPQWDFGHGRSYTKVEYANLNISQDTLNPNETLIVEVEVTNSGKMDTKEVVQLYLSDHFASTIPNGKSLKGFKKIDLKAGEKRTVKFALAKEHLQFVGQKGAWVIEAGDFSVSIDQLQKNFYLKI